MSAGVNRPATTKVLISDVGAARFGARIRAVSPAVELVPVAEHGPLPDPSGAEVAFITRDLFIGGSRHKPNPRFVRFIEWLQTAPKLRGVQTVSPSCLKAFPSSVPLTFSNRVEGSSKVISVPTSPSN